MPTDDFDQHVGQQDSSSFYKVTTQFDQVQLNEQAPPPAPHLRPEHIPQPKEVFLFLRMGLKRARTRFLPRRLKVQTEDRIHPATFQCTLCPKRFIRAYELRSHLRTHTDERPYTCFICGKAFARLQDRKGHESLHNGEEKFVCGGVLQDGENWGCGMQFFGAYALGGHFESETGRVCIRPLVEAESRNEASSIGPTKTSHHHNQGLPPALLQQYPALASIDLFDPSRLDELKAGPWKYWADYEWADYETDHSDEVSDQSREMRLEEAHGKAATPLRTPSISAETYNGPMDDVDGEMPEDSTSSVLSGWSPPRLCNDPVVEQDITDMIKKAIELFPGGDDPRISESCANKNAPPSRDGIPEPDVAKNILQGTTHVSAPVPSDSGYHSGVGTDTESVCSMGSVGSSLGLPQNFLQEFIAFFGDTLIEKASARQWAGYTLAHWSSEEVEKQLATLLKDYAVQMASNPPSSLETKNQKMAQDEKLLASAINLIRRYRPKIARYFRDNAVSAPASAASLSERLQGLGQQLSLTERLGLLIKPESEKVELRDMVPDLPVDEEMKDVGDDGEVFADLGPVRDLLVSGEAFDKLASDLRRRLYHDDVAEMKAIRSVVLNGNLRGEARFTVYWSILEFMRSQYGEDLPRIGSTVVLTGTALYAHATTCAKYVKTTWPRIGSAFIELLDEYIQGGTASKVRLACTDLSLAIVSRHDNKVEFSARAADETLLVELAQQIAWIGSALSAPPFDDQLAYAKPSLKQTALPRDFEIMFEHTQLHTTETACWLPLFCGAAIATGFPIPERVDEMGLEISLELLAGIAGVRHAVEYEGGLVMKGFSHMFVPVRKRDNRVQWHAISSQDTETRLTYSDALSRCETRASSQEVSFNDLQCCRAIVGWCSVAKTTLGCDSARYENIDYSGAADANSNSAIRCAGGSLGFQQFGTAALDFKFGVKEGKCHFQRNGPYRRIVSASEKTPIVLYDTGEQRAWLVPASDVMLHMVQHRHWLDPFEMQGNQIKLDTNVTTSTSARSVLLRNQSLRLSDDDGDTFKDVILNIWSLLEFLIDQNVARDRNSPGTPLRGTLREFLDGFEFKAVVEERSPFRQKQTPLSKTNGGWPLLVRDIDALVLLADGFEDIIKPAEEGNICRAWKRVPKGQDYLATSCKMLKELYDVAGCRLNRKYLTCTHLQWHQGDSLLFDACDTSKVCQCDRLQQILPKSTFGTLRPPEYIADQGAVIFGHSGSLAQDLRLRTRARTPKVSGLYSHPNVSLTPIVLRHESEDSNISDDHLSGRSGSDATADSAPGSLSSRTTLTSLDASSGVHELLAQSKIDTTTSPSQHLHFPDIDDGEHGKQESFARKRAKSVHTYDSSHLSPIHRYPEASSSSPHHKHTRSDSETRGKTRPSKPEDEPEDAQEPAVSSYPREGKILDSESVTPAHLPFRIADADAIRSLRRKQGLHFEKEGCEVDGGLVGVHEFLGSSSVY